MKPTNQTKVAIKNTRLFQTRACTHRAANSGSLGHCWGRTHNTQAVTTRRIRDMENIQGSYSANVTRIGSELVSVATTAPKPKLTNKIGKAQHSRVPVDASRVIQLKARC